MTLKDIRKAYLNAVRFFHANGENQLESDMIDLHTRFERDRKKEMEQRKEIKRLKAEKEEMELLLKQYRAEKEDEEFNPDRYDEPTDEEILLKQYRAKEESDRRREVESMGMEDVGIPADPPAPPVPPVRPAAPPARQCDCRVASGTRLVPGRCKAKGKYQEFDEDGNPKFVCGRHKNAIDNCMEKYMNWSRERGHLYGWFEEGDDTWRERLSPPLNPFYKAPKRKPKRARPANSQYRGVVRGIEDPVR